MTAMFSNFASLDLAAAAIVTWPQPGRRPVVAATGSVSEFGCYLEVPLRRG